MQGFSLHQLVLNKDKVDTNTRYALVVKSKNSKVIINVSTAHLYNTRIHKNFPIIIFFLNMLMLFPMKIMFKMLL